VAGGDVRLDTVIVRDFVARWFKQFGWLPAPFRLADLFAIERSALWYVSGLWSWAN
jgi:hypothetical protein